MNQKKMQVLYIEQTGHILAAFTREAAAESLIDVSSLAGTDLIVRNEKKNPAALTTNNDRGETLSVPIDLLEPKIVDLNENAFVMPFNFMVGGGQANKIVVPALLILGNPTLTTDEITITTTLPSGVTTVPEETKVWAQVQEKEDSSTGSEPIRRIVAGTITPQNASTGSDGKSVTLTLRTRPNEQPTPILTGKTYFVLVLVAGRPPDFFTKSL